MAYERTIKRYSAYYAGWCVAFGEHEIDFDEKADIQWVSGDSTKIGITLSPRLRKLFIRALLGKHDDMPEVVLGEHWAQVGRFEYSFSREKDRATFENFRSFFRCPEEIHMFLTSHFCYPQGTRIITFCKKKPLLIMYKEIEPLRLKIL